MSDDNTHPLRLFIYEWELAKKEYNLSIVFCPLIVMTDGHEIMPILLLENFGHTKGMLIEVEGDDLLEYRDELVELGYGFSHLSYPSAGSEFHHESFIEMLSDWGWTGNPETKPDWIIPDHLLYADDDED